MKAGESALDTDTRSDVYSLGVMLYELLTGTTPFSKERLKLAAYDEMRRIIREEEPPRPSTRLSELSRADQSNRTEGRTAEAKHVSARPAEATSLALVAALRKTEPHRLGPLLRGELDWIVMKALEKDRMRRYATALGLASDIQHFLADEPVEACPPSAAYRFRKFVRRNRMATTLAALSLLTFIATGVTAVALCYNSLLRMEVHATEIQRDRADQESQMADRERMRAEAESRRATEQESLAPNLKCDAQMNLAHQAWQKNQVDLMADLLIAAWPEPRRQVESVSAPMASTWPRPAMTAGSRFRTWRPVRSPSNCPHKNLRCMALPSVPTG